MTRNVLIWILVLGLLAPCSMLAPVVRPALAQDWQTHVVRRGENLTVIAEKYGATVQDLRDWNELRSDELAIGQSLRIPESDSEWYLVRRGDSLSEIAAAHDISLTFLRSLNHMQGNTIYPGQRLRVRPSPRDEAVHVVRPGDSLSRIAEQYGVTLRHLKNINDLSGSTIYPGQKLRLREAAPSVHIVERGDALWEIAEAYGLSLKHLKNINGLTSDRIYPGQELRLNGATAPRIATYEVKRGDNLNEIARLHQMSLRELRQINGITGSLIRPGQELKVRPLLGGAATAGEPGTILGNLADLDLDALLPRVPGVSRLQTGNGPYYYEAPQASAQKSRGYFEKAKISPALCYSHGRELMDRFDAELDKQPPLSRRLAGWTIVLDPGHGGIDPGTIVSAKDAAGRRYYVVEDEYVYDLALRVYALLRLHGADVTMTLLSPNHLLRRNTTQDQTFVHDRSEVFNDKAWNRHNREDTHPMGRQKYLDERKNIAGRAYADGDARRSVFLSFHADNDPESGGVFTLFHYQGRQGTDTVSRAFARGMLPAMGAGARTRGRNLGVLRGNPAHYKLLVEMRNLAFADHVWAIRYGEIRQRDAEKVVKALLEAVEGLDPVAKR
ncbi:hypothetical protein CO151_09525 [bacterium CG_4_9_14_3_um_filter_65_15]|nr:MAG: hypothetical protein CO151_09525 [bacterium CG_4_9_14_3_um_filter_65_15]